MIPTEVTKQSLTGSIWLRRLILNQSLHSDWPDQDHMTSPKTRVNPPESHRLSMFHPPFPSKENWIAAARMGVDAEQAKQLLSPIIYSQF